jgi:hypothetical protein
MINHELVDRMYIATIKAGATADAAACSRGLSTPRSPPAISPIWAGARARHLA